MTRKQEKRFYDDMSDEAKREVYIRFVEQEEARFRAKQEEDALLKDTEERE